MSKPKDPIGMEIKKAYTRKSNLMIKSFEPTHLEGFRDQRDHYRRKIEMRGQNQDELIELIKADLSPEGDRKRFYAATSNNPVSFAAKEGPFAYDIAMAKFVHIVDNFLQDSLPDDPDALLALGYELGFLNSQIAYLSLAPDLPVDAKSRAYQFHTIDVTLRDDFRKNSAKAARRKQAKEINTERNAQLCQTAERLRAANIDDHNLAGSTKRAWDSGGLWERHKVKKIRIKQIRQILRDGGVLPPAKTKKEK